MTGDIAPCDGFLVVFRNSAGVPVGLGVLVGVRKVLTCAHVVNAALGLPHDAPDRPARPVRVGWPKLAGCTPISAEVVAWRPLADGDLAALRLAADCPPGAVMARLDVQVPAGTALLQVFGYPEGRPKGQWADVRAVGTVEGGWLQLNSRDASTPDVRAGFSGSPVYDPQTGAVVGLVAEAPGGGHSRDSLAIPAAQLLAFADGGGDAGGDGGGAARSRRPERTYGPASELTVLHLSDPQFGQHHLFGGNGLTVADRDRDSLFVRLHEDLAKLAGTHGLWPDLVVVTGDLAETGLRSEFDQVVEFLQRLVEALELPRHRVAIVPGNHDVNRKACEHYFSGEEADEREPGPPYWPKWRHFAAAFDQFMPLGPGRALGRRSSRNSRGPCSRSPICGWSSLA